MEIATMVHALWIQAGKKDWSYIARPPKGHWNKTILPASVPGARTRSKTGLMSSAVNASQAPTKAIKMNATRNRKEYGFRKASNRWTWVITQRPSADQARRVPRINKSSPYGRASQAKARAKARGSGRVIWNAIRLETPVIPVKAGTQPADSL